MNNQRPRNPGRSIAIGAFLLALSLLWGGCNGTGESNSPGSSGNPPLRVAIPGISATVWPLIYAQEHGIYAEEGVQVELNRIRGVPQIIATLMSGDVDVAWVGFDGMASAVARGATELRYIGEFLTEFPLYLVVAPGINSYHDLRGKTVAAAGAGSITDTICYQALKMAGLKNPRADTDYINMHGSDNRLNQLYQGNFQGVCLSPPWAQMAQERGYRTLQYIGDLLHPWGGEGPITHTRVVAEKRQSLQGLVNSLSRAIGEMKANREQTVALGIDYLKLEPSRVEELYDIMIPVLKTDGKWTVEGIQRALNDKTGPDRTLNAGDFLDDSFLSQR